MIKEPKLNSSEQDSSVGVTLRQHLEERIAKLRAANDKPVDIAQTNLTRGAIRELKKMEKDLFGKDRDK